MIKKFCIAILVLLCSCKQIKSEQKTTQKNSTSKIDTLKSNNTSNYRFYPNTNWLKNIPKDSITEMYWKKIVKRDSLNKKFKHDLVNSFPLKDKTIIFLWEGKEHKSLINQVYCKTISEPERAALGYIALLNGTMNPCYDKTRDEECTMRNALNLDNTYTDCYKYYMQFWFRNDIKSLETINHCYPISASFKGASVYYYFTQITLIVKENKIYIYFNGKAFNRDIWNYVWTEKIVFLVDKDNIKLIEQKKSKNQSVYD